MATPKTLLVPFDFSKHSRAALDLALEFARVFDATLHLVHVVQPVTQLYGYGSYTSSAIASGIDFAALRESLLRELHEVIDRIEGFDGRIEPHVVEGIGPADLVRSCAEEFGADLIVMGTHGRTGFAHVFLGSVAERTLRLAPCPVLTVRAPDDESDD